MVSNASAKAKSIKTRAFEKNGATVSPEFTPAVTHVLVGADSEVDPAEFGAIPVLKEKWASDSIQENTMLPLQGYEWTPEPPKSSSPPKEPEDEQTPVKATVKPSRAVRQGAFHESLLGGPAGNQEIIEFFHDLMDQRDSAGKEFSKRAYAHALEAIEQLPVSIKSVSQARRLLPDVFSSSRMAEALETVLHKKIPEPVLERMRQKGRVLQLFQTAVYGVGPSRARELYAKGCRTLEDVRSQVTDPKMIVSIDHAQDFLERISRLEVQRHYEFVKSVVHKLDPQVEVLCMGSYRREEKDCGDIDIIITKDDQAREIWDLLEQVVHELYASHFAQYTFGGGADSFRWLGASALPDVGKWRRMDILAVPRKELGGALLYYTGNSMFNRYMRLRAQKLDMHLTERGLFYRDTDVVVASESEREIFDKLGIKWCEPKDRYPQNFELVEPREQIKRGPPDLAEGVAKKANHGS